jgi:FimV-like protein
MAREREALKKRLTVQGHDRIPELLAEGRELLGRSRFPEAADVFGRILLLDPQSQGARLGLQSARRAAAEAERQLDATLDDAHAAIDAGDVTGARRLLEHVVENGGNRDAARALLDRLDRREGRLFVGARSLRASQPSEAQLPRSGGRWSRSALALAWASCFALVAAGLASSWERLVRGLVEPPAPALVAGPPLTQAPAPSAGERAVVEARRLAEHGDAAAALALLDGISPDEPAYPFARQFRAQVAAAARHAGRAQ